MISSFLDLVLSIRNLIFGDATIEAKAPTSGAGNSLTLKASDAASGNTNGGDITLAPGVKSGSGTDGAVVVIGESLPQLFVKSSTNVASGFESWSNGSTLKLMNIADAPSGIGIIGTNTNHALVIRTNNTLRMTIGTTGNVLINGFPAATVGLTVQAAASQTANLHEWLTNAGAVCSAVNKDGCHLFPVLVEANTAGSGSPNVLLAAESGTVLTNEASTAQNYHTLPTAAAGYVFDFIVQDSDGMRIVASTGDTIRDVSTVSSTAGYIQSTTVGSTLRLVAINATEWIVFCKQGTWTIDS